MHRNVLKITHKPVRDQLRRQCHWLGQTFRQHDNYVAKQVLQWTTHGYRDTGRPKNSWRIDLQK